MHSYSIQVRKRFQSSSIEDQLLIILRKGDEYILGAPWSNQLNFSPISLSDALQEIQGESHVGMPSFWSIPIILIFLIYYFFNLSPLFLIGQIIDEQLVIHILVGSITLCILLYTLALEKALSGVERTFFSYEILDLWCVDKKIMVLVKYRS